MRSYVTEKKHCPFSTLDVAGSTPVSRSNGLQLRMGLVPDLPLCIAPFASANA